MHVIASSFILTLVASTIHVCLDLVEVEFNIRSILVRDRGLGDASNKKISIGSTAKTTL